MRPEGSLPSSHSPTFTPIVSTSPHHIPFMFSLTLSCLLRGLPGCRFDFLPPPPKKKNLICISLLLLHVPHVTCIWSFMIDPPNNIWWEMAIAKLLVVQYSRLPLGLLHPSLTQVSSSVHCSRTHKAYVLPSVWEPKISNHIKQNKIV